MTLVLVLVVTIIALFESFSFAVFLRQTKCQIEPDSQELIRKWSIMEDQLLRQSGYIASQYRLVLDDTLNSSSLTSDCERDLRFFINDFEKLRKWAVEMHDANGNRGSLFAGTFFSAGSYDECLGVKTTKNEMAIMGKYCLVDLKVPLPKTPKNFEKGDYRINVVPRKTQLGEELAKIVWVFYNLGYRFGVCLPSNCQNQDVQYLSDTVASGLGFSANVHSCEVKTGFLESIQTDQLVIGVFLIIFICMVLVASLICEQNTSLSKTSDEKTLAAKSYLRALSIKDNWANIATLPVVNDQALISLYGLRLLTVIWILLAHSYAFVDLFLLNESLVIYERFTDRDFQILGNAYLAVDSFVYITGVLIAYNVEKLEFRSIIIHQFRRFYRLTMPCLVVIAIMIIVPLFGSGPLWQDIVGGAAENCRNNYWKNLFCVANFLKLESMCLPQLWYVSMDIQIFPLALMYLYLRERNSTHGQAYLAFLIAASSISTILVVYIYNEPPVPIYHHAILGNVSDTISRVYTPFYNHVGIYAIGLFVGTYARESKPFVFSRSTAILGWILSFTGVIGVMFGISHWQKGAIPNLWDMMAYGGLHRIVWGLSLAWLTLYCRSAPKGTLNRLLSWKGFIVLSRMTFAVYLLQEIVIYVYTGSLSGGVEPKVIYFIWLFVTNTVITFALALVFRLFFEGPLLEIERIWFARYIEATQPPTQVQNGNSHDNFKNTMDYNSARQESRDKSE